MKPALLYLVHRIPYPPNKGDKIRSFNLLKMLHQHYRVYLAAFVDDPADYAYAEVLKGHCEQLLLVPLHPLSARLRSLMGLLRREPLTLAYYHSRRLQGWVDRVVERQAIGRALVFSSAMAQFVLGEKWRCLRRVVDFVDVDSSKWRQYAETRRWPMNWLYQREARVLLDFERRVIAECGAATLVSDRETALFRRLVSEFASKISCAKNGVDLDYFAPDRVAADPYAKNDKAIAFVGAMDYWPNVDAVTWFAKAVFPLIRARVAQARFYIVGSNPTAAVTALRRCDGVEVLGRVEDVRPYVVGAAVSVAPLRIARGVQNKVLESMALGRPTVVSPAALEGIDAQPGRELLLARNEFEFVEQVCRILNGEIDVERLGAAARACVQRRYDWGSNLAVFRNLLERQHASERAASIACGQ